MNLSPQEERPGLFQNLFGIKDSSVIQFKVIYQFYTPASEISMYFWINIRNQFFIIDFRSTLRSMSSQYFSFIQFRVAWVVYAHQTNAFRLASPPYTIQTTGGICLVQLVERYTHEMQMSVGSLANTTPFTKQQKANIP